MSAHQKKQSATLCVSWSHAFFFSFFYADSYTVSVSDLDSESYFFLFYLFATFSFLFYLIYKECVDIVSIFVCCLFMRICHLCFVEIFAVFC